MAVHKIVYLWCEAKGRDFESRLLLAAHLLKSGCAVAVGQQWSIASNRANALKGCFLFNTANVIQGREMELARNAGHLVAASDAEGLPFTGDGFLVNISPAAMQHTHLFLAHSEDQHRILRQRYPELAIATTGSARVDLMRSAKALRPIPGPYILFNTNFALTNSVWGDLDAVVKRLVAGGGLDPRTPEGRAELQTRLDFEVATRNEILPLVRWCAQTFPITTVVRPHPAENAATWMPVEGKNLRVIVNSDPMPWIANAKLVIHANSTTGLEAALFGTPCLNISPRKFDGWVSQFVMRNLNATVPDQAAARRAISAFMKSGRGLVSDAAAVAFPMDGAHRTAAAVVGLLDQHHAQPAAGALTWHKFPRPDVARAKFSATRDEFALGLENVARDLSLPRVAIHELDDFLVLMTPQA